MKKDNYIKEKEITNQAQAMDPEELITLLDLIKTHVCKIYCKDSGHGTGFFCYIPIGPSNFLTTLMTNYHVLNINDIQPGQIINFTIDNDEKEYKILIDNDRKTYTNESYDVTIIEIKEDDEIDKKSFFKLDEEIFKKTSSKIFQNCQIYLLHYPHGTKIKISPGVIKNIIEDGDCQTIYHLCDTSTGSSGCPIINKTNFQVIGIHKGASKEDNYNLGTLLKEPVEKFNEEIKMKKNNIYNKDNNNNKNNYIKKHIKIEEKKEKKNEKLEINKSIEHIINKKDIEKNK